LRSKQPDCLEFFSLEEPDWVTASARGQNAKKVSLSELTIIPSGAMNSSRIVRFAWLIRLELDTPMGKANAFGCRAAKPRKAVSAPPLFSDLRH
jgi:hypothetical protein